MRFTLIDTVLEQTPDRIVALKNVTLAEEYLGDHFPGFPVLPGVFMVEAMVQAARKLLDAEGATRHVLGGVRALRYGNFVRPGESLRVEVTVDRRLPDGSIQFRGSGYRVASAWAAPEGAEAAQNPSAESRAGADTAVAGRFTMRPLRSAAST